MEFLAANRAFFSFTSPTVLVITSLGAKFLRTADRCRKFFAAYLTDFRFGDAGTFGNFFACHRTIRVVSAIDGLKLLATNGADKCRFLRRRLLLFKDRVNSFVLVFGDKLKVGNVVVVVIEVAVVNVTTVGNFAVEVHPNETMQTDGATVVGTFFSVEFQTRKFFLSVADTFNGRHVAVDFANHFFDGERFLRSLDALAQEFE